MDHQQVEAFGGGKELAAGFSSDRVRGSIVRDLLEDHRVPVLLEGWEQLYYLRDILPRDERTFGVHHHLHPNPYRIRVVHPLHQPL